MFSKPRTLTSLERLIHPAVFDEIDKNTSKLKRQSHTLFLVEIPFFTKQSRSRISMLSSPCALQRIMRRAVCHPFRFSCRGVYKRMLRQIDPAEKAARADFIIENDGDLEHLKTQVREIYTQLHSIKRRLIFNESR